ncbi:MAG TPA: glycosyltransferase family 2 protein [Flavobacteriaceae bacterium]|nr:glycosyl transferase family 2 [Flavobacteriaceae bacterium]MAY54188.1 glycosyl transferase family 2 [Flavobacteriaceae bacterium]HBR55725.1 glycosyl transferase family 2 [Flavobacteriaceae bacterium]HIB48682.1 glycosyltransferase family 2 protein [Flavobacteriaceae bacterium]HIO00291.1 glycosyltransferase family 2 protein [Flavobacteriaceae bacterium]
MELSVVILNYNVQYFLEQCILSVQRAIGNLDAEIIVVDNASSDDSCAMVTRKFPQITLIQNKENVGFSKANNQAVAIAKGKYVCILNPDTAVAEDTFLKCLQKAEKLTNLGAMGIHLLDGTGHFLPESKRNLPTPFVSLKKVLGFTKKYYANHISDKEEGEVQVLVGAFMLLERSIYKDVGGFDEDYFMYGEDIDLSYKIEKAGYKNYYLGTTETLHYKGESTQKDAAYLQRFYGAMQIFYRKHFKSNVLFDMAVKIGVSLAKSAKKQSVGRRKSDSANVAQAIVITDNINLLKQLSEKIDIPLKSSSKSMFQNGDVQDTLLIFDSEYIPYNQIFQVMRQYKGRGNRYRIRPPGCSFLIGSDQSDDKGGVVVFD